jgi:pre-rRNA-processing protein TSR3
MQSFPPTYLIRHRKENLKKCSLSGLETAPTLRFLTYPVAGDLPDISPYLLLAIDGPPLTSADASRGLLLLDATWRYAERMRAFIEGHPSLKNRLESRSIPKEFSTAYPRKQTDCPDPDQGLASIEALYIAYSILNRDTNGLLDHYYWRESFLQKNSNAFKKCPLEQRWVLAR